PRLRAKRRASGLGFLRSDQRLAEIAPARYDGGGGQPTAAAKARRTEAGLGCAGPCGLNGGTGDSPARATAPAPPSIVDSLPPLDLASHA
ncbi:MAG: hypothetical protein ACK53L_22805, partial [Pirellulaceae bacterium]